MRKYLRQAPLLAPPMGRGALHRSDRHDRERANRVVQAMFGMRKLDLAALLRAADGVSA